jgi:hypothetical protein
VQIHYNLPGVFSYGPFPGWPFFPLLQRAGVLISAYNRISEINVAMSVQVHFTVRRHHELDPGIDPTPAILAEFF